jgi:hypothetical protein
MATFRIFFSIMDANFGTKMVHYSGIDAHAMHCSQKISSAASDPIQFFDSSAKEKVEQLELVTLSKGNT